MISEPAQGEQTAEREPLSGWMASLPDEYCVCRDFGHNWRPSRAAWSDEYEVWEREMRCGRCGTVRSQDLSRRGEVLRSSYAYPDDYQAPQGVGRLSSEDRGWLRISQITRFAAQGAA
jgi:hypothetical protein